MLIQWGGVIEAVGGYPRGEKEGGGEEGGREEQSNGKFSFARGQMGIGLMRS